MAYITFFVGFSLGVFLFVLMGKKHRKNKENTEWKPELKVQPLQYVPNTKVQEKNEKPNFSKAFEQLPITHKLICVGVFLVVLGVICSVEKKYE